MGYEWDNDCVSCERCVNCGRGDYKAWYCDKCGFYEGTLYKGINGEELCLDCFLEQYESKYAEESDKMECNICGDDVEKLYYVDGQWVCEDCLLNMAETVDMEGE